MTDASETAFSRRQLILGGAMVATAGGAVFLKPTITAPAVAEKTFEGYFPEQLGDWRYLTAAGFVLPPKDQLSESLYDHLLTRVYRDRDDRQVMLLVAYAGSQEGHVMVHRPEICYPASGYRLTQNLPLGVRLDGGFALPTRFIEAQNDARREFIVYWTRIGPALPTTWLDQRIAMARENISGRLPDGILVRVSTIAADMEDARGLLERFTHDMLESVSVEARRLMIGAR